MSAASGFNKCDVLSKRCWFNWNGTGCGKCWLDLVICRAIKRAFEGNMNKELQLEIDGKPIEFGCPDKWCSPYLVSSKTPDLQLIRDYHWHWISSCCAYLNFSLEMIRIMRSQGNHQDSVSVLLFHLKFLLKIRFLFLESSIQLL